MRRAAKPHCIIATVESDAHSWNLVYLNLKMREMGFRVWNLGSCTPPSLIFDTVAARSPSLVVISSVNGHGFFEARRLMQAVRAQNLPLPFLIGGKLTTNEADSGAVRDQLLAEGYAGVFTGPDAVQQFDWFVSRFKDTALVMRCVA